MPAAVSRRLTVGASTFFERTARNGEKIDWCGERHGLTRARYSRVMTVQRSTPKWVSDEFIRLCIDAELPPIRVHDLRHGAASLMLAANFDMKLVGPRNTRPRESRDDGEHLHVGLPRRCAGSRRGGVGDRPATCTFLVRTAAKSERGLVSRLDLSKYLVEASQNYTVPAILHRSEQLSDRVWRIERGTDQGRDRQSVIIDN